jgi:hypothetical protein
VSDVASAMAEHEMPSNVDAIVQVINVFIFPLL